MLFFYGIFPYGVAHNKYENMVESGSTLDELKETFDGTGDWWVKRSLSSSHKKPSDKANMNQIWPNYPLFDLKCGNGNNEINFDITGYMGNEQKQYAGKSFVFIATLGRKMRLLEQHLPSKVWNNLISSEDFPCVLLFTKKIPGLGEKYIPDLDAISEDGIEMYDKSDSSITIYKEGIAERQKSKETDRLLIN
jgi:hypothetical protein